MNPGLRCCTTACDDLNLGTSYKLCYFQLASRVSPCSCVQVQKARNELYARDGEVKFLKDSLHKQEAELEKLRAEREERLDLFYPLLFL